MDFIVKISDFLWGWPLLIVILVTAVTLTIRTGAIQFRRFRYMLKTTFGSILKKDETKGEGVMSPLKLVLAAMAGTIGTGNIAGVGLAIGIGGPGAVFWLWVAALFSMVCKYSEIVLGVKYREFDEETGEYKSGPMYYIRKGLGSKWAWLAMIYALLFGVGYFVMGFVQSNTIAAAMKTIVGVKPMITGIVLVILLAGVVFGGLKSLVKVSDVLVPIMTIVYFTAAIVVIILNITKLPAVFVTIVTSAFSGSAAIGGFVGSTVILSMRQGFARAVYSNDGGVGLGAVIHGQAITTHPAKQGMWGIFEVFVDTIIVCTATALVIMFTGVYDSGLKGLELTSLAFSTGLPGQWLGKAIVCISVILFGYTTAINNNFLFQRGMFYVFEKSNKKVITIVCGLLSLAGAMIGAMGGLEFIWGLSDFFLALVILINVPVVLALSGQVRDLTREYFGNGQHKK